MLKHGLCRTMRRHSISSAYIFSIAAGSGAIRLVHSPADVGVLEKKVVSAPDNAIDFTRLRAWWRPDTSTLLNGSQLSTSFRSALLRASGGPNKNSNSGKHNKKDENGGDGENEGDDDAPEAWIVPRTCLFVVSVLLMSFLLWKMAQPRGVHTGWASMLQHAGEIELIKLYEHYAQVYATDRKVHLGLVSDADTQQHLDQLSDARMKAVEKAKQERAELLAQKAKQPKPASTDAAAKGTEQKPAVVEEEVLPEISEAELQVMLAGRPMAESALYGLGVFAWVVPFVFFPVFVMLLSQYIGKSLSYAVDSTKGKTKAKEMIFKVERACGTKFRDIAGMKEPKKEITEIVDFLRHPERYTKLGAKIPTGALLLGPPGTGKTLLAKAVAGESDVAFIPVCGSDFVELYVGMGALRVRQLFKVAKKQRCIIYIDEIDAIGLKRQGSGHGEKQEQEQTLNELLTQLDGFKTGKRGEVMVLASSNVAQEALDPALIRPGRFDRIIHVDTPVISERIDIFKVHLSKLKLTEQASSVEEEAKEAEATDKTEKEEEEEEVLVATSNATTPAATATPVAGAETSTQEAATATTSATSSVDAASPTTKDAPTSDETAVVVSTLTDPADAVDPADYHFDFHSLLANKSETERALIDAYADRMSNLCPGFVGADIANVCNEGAILAAREDASHVHIHHLERSIDRVLAGIEHRSRAMSDFEKNVVAHHEAGHAVAGWFLSRADPLMKVSIVPRGGSALGYAQYLPSENRNRTAQEIKDSIAVTLGGRIAEKIFFDHLSTGASDDLRKVGRMAYEYVASFYPGSVYPAPGSSHTRYVKPFGERRSNLFDQRAKQLVDEVYQETYALLLSHKKDMEVLAAHLLKHELLTYQDVVKYLGARKDRPTDRKKTV